MSAGRLHARFVGRAYLELLELERAMSRLSLLERDAARLVARAANILRDRIGLPLEAYSELDRTALD